jgi:hypothetical protein
MIHDTTKAMLYSLKTIYWRIIKLIFRDFYSESHLEGLQILITDSSCISFLVLVRYALPRGHKFVVCVKKYESNCRISVEKVVFDSKEKTIHNSNFLVPVEFYDCLMMELKTRRLLNLNNSRNATRDGLHCFITFGTRLGGLSSVAIMNPEDGTIHKDLINFLELALEKYYF